jgi:hypothetical protein
MSTSRYKRAYHPSTMQITQMQYNTYTNRWKSVNTCNTYPSVRWVTMVWRLDGMTINTIIGQIWEAIRLHLLIMIVHNWHVRRMDWGGFLVCCYLHLFIIVCCCIGGLEELTICVENVSACVVRNILMYVSPNATYVQISNSSSMRNSTLTVEEVHCGIVYSKVIYMFVLSFS